MRFILVTFIAWVMMPAGLSAKEAIQEYDLVNPEGAAKILDSEPAGDAKTVQLGDAARLYGQSLIFRKGPVLVRIVAYEGSAETPQAIFDLGRTIAGRLTK